VQVLLAGLGGPERHVLPAEAIDGPATLCGLPRPGRWYPAGFTSRPDVIECPRCQERARDVVAAR
jgi:hypothetical protein